MPALWWTTAAERHRQQFQDQKAAMIVIGPWEFADFNADKGLSWGVASIPVRSGNVAVGPLVGEVWVIPEDDTPGRGTRTQALRFLTSPASTYSWASQNGEIASHEVCVGQLIAKRSVGPDIRLTRSSTRSPVHLRWACLPGIDTGSGAAVQAVISASRREGSCQAAEAQCVCAGAVRRRLVPDCLSHSGHASETERGPVIVIGARSLPRP